MKKKLTGGADIRNIYVQAVEEACNDFLLFCTYS